MHDSNLRSENSPTSNPSSNRNDDVVAFYLRQITKLPRLSYEEELFHVKGYDEFCMEFGSLLSYLPGLLKRNIEKCKKTEIIDLQESEDTKTKEDKVRNILAYSQYLISFAKAEDKEDTGDTRKKLSDIIRTLRFHGGFYQTCFKEASNLEEASMLSPKHKGEVPNFPALFSCFQGWEKSRNMLIEGNLRLVVSIAKKYAYYGLPFSDLIQEGNISLLQAIDKFRPEKGHRFSTYAVWWIRQGINKALSKHSRTIRIPANIANDLSCIRRGEEKLLQKLGHEPKEEEIAEAVEMSTARVRALRKMERQTISLQATVHGDIKVYDLIGDDNIGNPADIISHKQLPKAIEDALATLTERERDIIIHRFGLLDKKTMTLEELSQKFSVSYERIRQIEVKSLEKLRHPSRRKYLDGYI